MRFPLISRAKHDRIVRELIEEMMERDESGYRTFKRIKGERDEAEESLARCRKYGTVSPI